MLHNFSLIQINRRDYAHLYSARIVINANTVNDILSASSYLQIASIVEACETYLTHLLNSENCLRTIQVIGECI